MHDPAHVPTKPWLQVFPLNAIISSSPRQSVTLLPSHFHLVLPCSSCSAPTAGATKPLFTEVHRMAPGGGSPRLAPHGLRVLAGRVRGADLRGVGLQPGEDELRLRRSPTSMTDEVIGLCPTPSIGPFGAFWGGRVRRRKGSI